MLPHNRSSDQISAADRKTNQGTAARKLTLRAPLKTNHYLTAMWFFFFLFLLFPFLPFLSQKSVRQKIRRFTSDNVHYSIHRQHIGDRSKWEEMAKEKRKRNPTKWNDLIHRTHALSMTLVGREEE
ncbi:hypothetical protein BDV30DRAFT_203961 [Aspergillus minisclerotigenes]|uniref:Uncharacterized protein n=1 Tax=Aspergillus minisclerotigenes TaxID=656917 RepID=A0A5N6JGM4_9EURO|nr:hypothetical protein BDV30DRAFT_203961 [Aspergillus minisclerotigenes]